MARLKFPLIATVHILCAYSALHSPKNVIRKEHAELSGRKTLHENQAELKRRTDIYQKIAKLQTALKACATKDISDQGSKLLKTHVTEALSTALIDEQR